MWAQATHLVFLFLLVGADHFQQNGNAVQRMHETEPLSLFERASNFITKMRTVFDVYSTDYYTTEWVIPDLMVNYSDFVFPPCGYRENGEYFLQILFIDKFFLNAYHVETTHISHACQLRQDVIRFVAEFKNESHEASVFMGFTLDEKKGLLIGGDQEVCDELPWKCKVIKNPIN